MGEDRSSQITALGNAGQYARALNSFVRKSHLILNLITHAEIFADLTLRKNLWLFNQGTFSESNLQFIWPNIGSSRLPVDDTNMFNGLTEENPDQGAFDYNWLPNGDGVDDLRNADP